MDELRVADDHVRILKGICHAFASASSVDELSQALARWIRTALRARTFSYSLYVPDPGSLDLRRLVFEGPALDRPELEDRRRYALDEKVPVRNTAGNPWETVVLLPMVTCGEAFGVLELTAPTAAIDGSLETLEAIASQGAIVLRNLRDISMLNNEVEAAIRLNRMREDRLNGAIALTAHEIKSPLLGTLAVMQVLEQIGVEDGRQLLHQAQRQLQELAALTDELLRLTLGAGEGDVETVELAEVVDEIVGTLPDEDRARVSVSKSSDVVASGDSLPLRSAIGHVLRHALRHTAKSEVVELHVGTSDSSALITVIDGGPPIPMIERENLFDPFARDASGTRSMDSLRLFAARRVIEAQGGEISVESLPTGACFRILIPAAAREEQFVRS